MIREERDGTVSLHIVDNLDDYRRQLARLEGVTEEQAKRAAAALARELRKAEESARAASLAEASRKLRGALTSYVATEDPAARTIPAPPARQPGLVEHLALLDIVDGGH